MTSPFDPTDDDLARIDRARAEAWLTAHGWERVGGWLHERALTAHDWRTVLHDVALAHDLRGLALWVVVVAWQAPALPDVGGAAADRRGVAWTRAAPVGQFGCGVWWRLDGGRVHRIGNAEGVALGLPAVTPWAPDAADVPRLLEEASAKARREKGGA